MLSHFTSTAELETLANYFNVPRNVYPIGRLDADSEGMLILTNDKKLNNLLLNPKFGHNRTYLVQVDGDITEEACLQLQKGIDLKIDGVAFSTLPAKIKKLSDEPKVPERNPPIRFRKNIPTSWIELSICEGKNRQVRRMTAAVGFPTLRLIRIAIENLTFDELIPCYCEEIEKTKIYSKLNIRL